VELRPSWQINSHSTSQKIYHLLWNLKNHDRAHWSLSWTKWIQSTYFHPAYHLRSADLGLGLPSSFPFSSFCRNIVFLLSPMRATCPAHLILLYFIQSSTSFQISSAPCSQRQCSSLTVRDSFKPAVLNEVPRHEYVSLIITSWRRSGEWRHSSTPSQPRH